MSLGPRTKRSKTLRLGGDPRSEPFTNPLALLGEGNPGYPVDGLEGGVPTSHSRLVGRPRDVRKAPGPSSLSLSLFHLPRLRKNEFFR